EGKTAIVEALAKEGKGEKKINYRMRDWLISRQRYWGTPIPMIHCEDCGVVPVPESDLPVLLPYDVDFTPDGTSPLLKHEGFMNVPCPVCGKPAKRDADTMDTFVCSSWYYLRYPDNKNEEMAFDPAVMEKLLPVDKYVGGAEHATMHLLYARFFTKVLRDLGYLKFDEPFTSLVHQGMILGPDGEKMSKNRGNVIAPDDYVEVYGSDIFRMYLMFGFNYVDGGAWSDGGIKAVSRFVDRVERLISRIIEMAEDADIRTLIRNYYQEASDASDGPNEKELKLVVANTIKSVTADLDRFMFNTSIARLMELVNAMYKYKDVCEPEHMDLLVGTAETLLKLLAPCAPHFSEEMNARMGGEYSITNAPWPTFNEGDLVKDMVNIAVQVSGKLRGRLDVPQSASDEEVEALAMADAKIAAALEGKTIRKVIVVKGRLVNIVAN
ncbi:class I tRNA ligase family protein, partial [Eubacteriales bacterium OttesenSCG-928-M02]|nr:class I tRNA ligase family protein [Eubacteriales bacterium OttesenSCG-928-M02]